MVFDSAEHSWCVKNHRPAHASGATASDQPNTSADRLFQSAPRFRERDKGRAFEGAERIYKRDEYYYVRPLQRGRAFEGAERKAMPSGWLTQMVLQRGRAFEGAESFGRS